MAHARLFTLEPVQVQANESHSSCIFAFFPIFRRRSRSWQADGRWYNHSENMTRALATAAAAVEAGEQAGWAEYMAMGASAVHV